MLPLGAGWQKLVPSGSFLAPQTLRLCSKCVSHCFRFLLTSPIAGEGVQRGGEEERELGGGRGRGRRGEEKEKHGCGGGEGIGSMG